MTWDATNKVLKVTLNLTVGAIKFRANDDWAVNLGGLNSLHFPTAEIIFLSLLQAIIRLHLMF